MKPPARRLGRGLGAFLDFDPAGDDGEAFIEDGIRGATSVLKTSTPAAELVSARAAPLAACMPVKTAAPRASAPVAAPPAPPPPAPGVAAPAPPVVVREPEPVQEMLFVDDEIVIDDSPPAEVRVASPPAPRAAVPPPPPVREAARERPPEPA